ncbi:hypothetical protein [Ensifer adhaerens]|uniref:hypothetical protein n=1 Tax=Ensifer adhaerens TaxID=106592 RepID=UPI00131A379E|nr:hypothetical protein [Ensifer adhaerens]
MKSCSLALSSCCRVLLVLLVVLWPTVAGANGMSFAGQWQQVASGTDDCERCWVEIRRNGPVLKVTGRDGWFAVTHLGRVGGGSTAEGIGRWNEDGVSRYRGKPFDIRITIVDEHLYMDMSVRMDDGSTQAVRAVFDKRRWEKSARRVMVKS